MAVTSVTITAGPTVVGRSVTISGTLARDGGGANNSFYFLCYDSTFTNSFTVRRLSDNSNLYDGSGTAGSGIAWTWTGTLPEGNYLGITAYQSGTDATLSSATASVGIIKLNPGLGGIWTPRRDARGLFVPKSPTYPIAGASRIYGSSDVSKSFWYPTPTGIYLSTVDAQWSNTNGNAYGVPTQYGMGLDAPSGWYWLGPGTVSAQTAPVTATFVSVFSLYRASTYVPSTKYVAVGTISMNAPSSDSNTYIWWRNSNGEQSLLINPSIGFGGASFSVSGIGNGLHCLVMQTTVGGGSTGVRTFLDGRLVAITQAPTYSPAGSPFPHFYWGSLSSRDLDIGNMHLYGEAVNYGMTDAQLAALSLDPYRYFFVDAPNQRQTLTGLALFATSFQYARPTTDVLTGWTRVPASGTHVSAINEATSNQTDYLQATSTGLVDSFTMQPIDQPLSGGVDINLDIDASARPVTVALLNGATVVKSATVSTTGQTTISATAAELSGVSWPWTPTVRITSQ